MLKIYQKIFYCQLLKPIIVFTLAWGCSLNLFSQLITPSNTVISSLMTVVPNTNVAAWQQSLSYCMAKTGGMTVSYAAGSGSPAVPANNTYGYGFDFNHTTAASQALGGGGSQYGINYSMDGLIRYFNTNNLPKSANQTYSSIGLI